MIVVCGKHRVINDIGVLDLVTTVFHSRVLDRQLTHSCMTPYTSCIMSRPFIMWMVLTNDGVHNTETY